MLTQSTTKLKSNISPVATTKWTMKTKLMTRKPATVSTEPYPAADKTQFTHTSLMKFNSDKAVNFPHTWNKLLLSSVWTVVGWARFTPRRTHKKWLICGKLPRRVAGVPGIIAGRYGRFTASIMPDLHRFLMQLKVLLVCYCYSWSFPTFSLILWICTTSTT